MEGTGCFLFFTVVFLIVLKVYSKKKKHQFQDKHGFGEECLSFKILPKVKNLLPFDPFKLVGAVHLTWPLTRTLQNVLKCAEEMGDLFRSEALGQDFVIFNSGPTLETLLKSGDFGHVHKAPLVYGQMKPFVSNGVLVSDGPFWQTQRKILMKSQSYLNLRGYMEMLNRHSEGLVETLRTLFQDGKSHPIHDAIKLTFLRVMSEMITGENLDRSDELHHYHKNFDFWKNSIPFRVVNPLLLIECLWRLHPRYKKHEQACQELCQFAVRRIQEAKKRRETNAIIKPSFQSVIDDLLDAEVDENQIMDEINVMMFGGHETGASAIHCLLFALALNPEVQQEARDEVDEFFLHSESENVSFEASQAELKYVERCIKEGMRLMPPIFAVFRKLQSPLKVEYQGKNVILPSGTNCIMSPFCVHRQEKYYPNPLKFDPDRFLPEEMDKRHPSLYFPFSAGPHNCLGKKFGMIEMKTIMAYILRNFELYTTDKMENVTWLPYTTTTPEKDFVFQLKKRQIFSE